MSDFAALLERVKAASEPDRELDAAIMLALLNPEYRYPEPVSNRVPSGYGEAYGRMYVEGAGDVSGQAPLLTASVDAALAFAAKALPDHYGFGWHKASYMPSIGPKSPRICAEVWNVEAGLKISSGYTNKHPALAIVEAVLTAIALREQAAA